MKLSRTITILALASIAASGLAAAAELSEKEQLGKAIFFDQNLSINKNQSCASCHSPAAGWTGATLSIGFEN